MFFLIVDYYFEVRIFIYKLEVIRYLVYFIGFWVLLLDCLVLYSVGFIVFSIVSSMIGY